MARHPRRVEGYSGTNGELAKDLSNLRYDSLAQILEMLATNIAEDSEKDARRGRVDLANDLEDVADPFQYVIKAIRRAGDTCEPYMDGEQTRD